MKSYLTSTALVVVLGAVSLPAAAQNFSDADTSADGQIDKTEFEQVSRASFDAWDTDRNERISERELYHALFAEWDADDNDQLTQEEYLAGAGDWLDENRQPAFDGVDADDSGTLNQQEFTSAMQDSEAFAVWNVEGEGVDWNEYHAAMFDRHDEDRNQQLSQDEYAAVVIVAAVPADRDPSDGQAGATGERSADTSTSQPASKDATAAISQNDAIPAEEVIALADWQMDEFYVDGISVDYLLDEVEVYGRTGEEIGSVQNLVFSRDGEVLSLIAEVGGFWDMFDTHVNVPWDQVSWDDADRLTIPVSEETVEDYSVFKTDYLLASEAEQSVEAVSENDLLTGMNAFRASDLIGDYARIRNGTRMVDYGYVNDLVIKDGKLQSVIVTPQEGYGVSGSYGYPYHGRGWYPAMPYYDMPYDRAEVIKAERIDYDRFGYN